MTRLGLILATCGYVGYVPVAPGTAGSAVGVALFYALRLAGTPWVEHAAIAVVFAAGVWASNVAEASWQRTDPGPVVIDEVLGMLITLWLLPVTGLGAFVGFLLFRVFDVIKPWPAARLEGLHGGFGVMADDAMAGVYAHLVMRGLVAVVPPGWVA